MTAFSVAPELSEQSRHVQDRVWRERQVVVDFFKRGATVYVCGDGEAMAPSVRQTLLDVYREATGASQERAEEWAEVVEREQGRYVADVFA